MELLFAVSEAPLTRLLQPCLLLSQGDTVELLEAWKYFSGMENIPKMSDINGQSKFYLRLEISHFRYSGKFVLLLHLLIYPLFSTSLVYYWFGINADHFFVSTQKPSFTVSSGFTNTKNNIIRGCRQGYHHH